jgi:hypothetical protein
MVHVEKIKPKKAAALMGIGYENGKAILKIFRREGRLHNNKIREDQNVDTECITDKMSNDVMCSSKPTHLNSILQKRKFSQRK